MKINKILYLFLILLISVSPILGATNPPTNISQTDATVTSITWTWYPNATHYNTSVYIDGAFFVNVTSPKTGTQTTTKTGLIKGTTHNIGILSYDSAFVRSTWVNSTGMTDGSMTDLWEFIEEITDNTNSIIALIVLGVLIIVVRRFGKGLAGMLNIGGK